MSGNLKPKNNSNMLYPSNQKAHSRPTKELAKNKHAQSSISLDFFFSFSKNIPEMNRRQDMNPETMEKERAKFEIIYKTSFIPCFSENLYLFNQ